MADWLFGATYPTEKLTEAWTRFLWHQFHDDLTGTSIPEAYTFSWNDEIVAQNLFAAVLADSARAVAGALDTRAEGLPLVVWNPNAGGRAQADGVVELAVDEQSGPLALHARDVGGRARPVHAEIAVPGHVYACYALPASAVAAMLRGFPQEFFGDPVCAAQRRREAGREALDVWLGDAPAAGFDWLAEREALARELEAEGELPLLFRPRRRPAVRVRFVDDFPGAGVRRYTLREGRVDSEHAPLRAEREGAGGARVNPTVATLWS